MFNIHPAFFIFLLMLAAVVAVVWVAWALTRSSRPVLPPTPQLSPDGKWWWDGQRWVPAEQGKPPS